MTDEGIYRAAKAVLLSVYGEGAQFREGQYEAIEAALTNARTLVVRRTGWGKSFVYFVCTKLLRSEGKGVTLVVSPLLSLMQNQIEAAEKLGLVCGVLNSTVKDRREDILDALCRGEQDLVLVTPETLFSQDVQSRLSSIRIGLFVIDEAHCISDWGHDFRLEYGKLKTAIRMLPKNVPVLATTATANDRVIEDLRVQLGGDVFVSRGSLTRESLSIQVLHLKSRIERYAWILENIKKLPGSGVIYCLTRMDCEYLADFLKKHGISAMPYYSQRGVAEAQNAEAENAFKHNKIKVIVATVKLGMGYDKGDIAFVIHYQTPSNIVSYYQQIGRAGRNIDNAYAFLMTGGEDEDILNHFIDTAFPSEKDASAIVNIIRENSGVTISDIEANANIRRQSIKKALNFLTNDGFVIKDGTKYYAAPKPFLYDRERYRQISDTRRREMEQIRALTETDECYSKFTVNCLDDYTAANCGRCANCLGAEILPGKASYDSILMAAEYVNGLVIPIEPRKMWPSSDVTPTKKIARVNQAGLCLSKYGEAGLGALVKRDKHSKDRRFCEELVGKSAAMLVDFAREKRITHVTFVPSLTCDTVEDFARRLASRLSLPFVKTLEKSPARKQNEMENSAHRCSNALSTFQALLPACPESSAVPPRVLLVDDVVDSGWTLTVCGYRLMECGCEEVYPFALADRSRKEV